MASYNEKDDDWLKISNKSEESSKIEGEHFSIIDQDLLNRFMDAAIEITEEEFDYSRLSSPADKSSCSTSSMDKVENYESVMNGSEWLWYWSSRPEINNFYNCSKWITEPTELSVPDQAISPNENKDFNVRHWVLSYLPRLLITHACTFILGAATMFFILKRSIRLTTTNVM